MPQYTTNTPGETRALGERLGRTLRGGELLAFTGGMGAGKTTFCTGLARGLGSQDAVHSPTFTIANLYRGRIPFAHFDAYRITAPDDLETAGFYDYLDDGAVVAVEWSERVAAFLPPPDITIDIAQPGETVRTITIEGAGAF